VTTQLGLLATVFLAGGALMSLEMASFRLVEPEFGSGIEVWGSLISVFLGGLAIGAVAGGWLADRRPALWKLGLVLLAGGAVTAILPLCSDPVFAFTFPGEGAPLPPEWLAPSAAEGTGGQITIYQPPDLRWPALTAGAILFGLPAILLGMVSPYAARLFVHQLPNMGSGVGQVYGVSTVGSIIGTLGTAFYLVSWMGTTWLLALNGLLLAALGLVLTAAHALCRDRHPAA